VLRSIARRYEPLSGQKPGPNLKDHTRPDSKHHLLVDASGVPFNVIRTDANGHHISQWLPLIDAIPRFVGCAALSQ